MSKPIYEKKDKICNKIAITLLCIGFLVFIVLLWHLTVKYITPYIFRSIIRFFNYDSFINYNNYQILKKYNNKDKAAYLLSNIDKNMNKLIDEFNIKYDDINQLNVCDKQKKLLKTIKYKLNKTYRSNSLQENFPTIVGKDVSYNVNKGEIISICLRNYNNPDEFHEFNDLLFVTIHEIAHSCNESYGHDKKFWKIFRILLEVAVEQNLYQNVNYQRQPNNYCSMKITYNPIFDRSLDDISYFT
jgi:hypothetical protein